MALHSLGLTSVSPDARYPATGTIGGLSLVLRPMDKDDGPAMIAFARSLPAEDRLFLRRDITRVAEVNAWVRRLDPAKFVTLLLVGEDGRIHGYANVDRNPLAWMNHVAELRVMVGPALRRHGAGRLLTEEAFRSALEMGVEKVVAQMMVEQIDAIAVFRSLGFQPEALLRDHVKDRNGVAHDLVVLSCHVASLASKLDAYGITEALGV